MKTVQGLLEWLQKKLSDRFIRNVGWLGAAQLSNRVFRLAATVVLARWLSPSDYGLAAVVLTTNEFLTVFTRSGIGSKIIQASAEDLDELCDTAYWLNWILCGSLFVLQCLLAVPIGWFYGKSEIALPIGVMAVVYLLVPLGYIQAMLLMRENRLKITAITNAAQLSCDCVLTIVFALLGMGLWALILPKVLVAPIWVIINYANHPWRAPRRFTLKRWPEIVAFARNILGVELLTTLRGNIDYLIVGRVLGVEALGVYYFAFNAGLGISLGVISAFSSALYPHLCAVNTDPEQLKVRFFSGLKTIALVAVPLVLLQSSLAPIYVPIIFGEKWVAAGAVPVLILVCLSALPRPFADAASQLLHAVNRTHLDLQWNLFFTLVLVAAIAVSTPWGIGGVALAVLVCHVLALPPFAVWTTRMLFAKPLTPSLS
ncbi:MAG: lipopolysaccharide biosynthesis protein [Gemmatimonadaceae bacterium]|nr:lipopolysaccharide biosynthesis protein [Gloeobacterales cyanobacterium ES-bin-141]